MPAVRSSVMRPPRCRSLGVTWLLIGLVAAVSLGALGCVDTEIKHTPRYGLYFRELLPDTPEARALLEEGYRLEREGQYAAALERFQFALRSNIAFEEPVETRDALGRGAGSEPAFEARREIARCYFYLGEFKLAHEALRDLVLYYRDFLGTEGQELWPGIRDMWWTIALNMYYEELPSEDNPAGVVRGNHDDTIKVLEAIIAEEPNGRTAAKAHVMIGRIRYDKGDYHKARDRFLRVVDRFQVYAEQAEEALYRAAYATLATQKGTEYDPSVYVARGGDPDERGSLDLCNDYDRQYPGGRFADEIRRLRDHLYAIQAFRQSDHAYTYKRLGYGDSALWAFRELVWDFYERRYIPEVDKYVRDAIKQVYDSGHTLEPQGEERQYYSDAGIARFKAMDARERAEDPESVTIPDIPRDANQ